VSNDDKIPGGESFAAMFAESERANAGAPKRRVLRVGDKVRGKLMSVGRETAFVELDDHLGEGMMDVIELRDDKGQLIADVGDVVEGSVAEATRRGGMVVLRRNAARGAGGRLDLQQAFQAAIAVEGTVTAVNKGGLEVDVGGVRAFCPISQLELRHVEDASLYIGQKLSFRITRYEPGENDRRGPNVVLSRRALLEDEARGRAAETREKLKVGAVLAGVVTGLKDYGAFVDLGGIEGMLHVSELGYGRVGRPSDVLSVGQPVSVQVLRIERGSDPKRPEQVALSLKALESDPWETATQTLVEGSRVRGTVTRVAAFGAFVELAPGLEGLVHISELGAGPSQRQARVAVKPGDPIDVTILAVDRERRRVSLSTAAPDEPLDADARGAVARAAGPSGGTGKPGKLGTLGDLLKSADARAKR
jgi:small subunit ribosomal protein S1